MSKSGYKFAGLANVAEHIRGVLAPSCERIMVAGSLRRGEKYVGDIELVAIPKLTITGIFDGQFDSELDKELHRMTAGGTLSKVRGGDKAKTYLINTVKPPVQLDLFIASEANWGLILALRTGPAAYSKKLVTQRVKGGWLDNQYRVKDGIVLKHIQAISGEKVENPRYRVVDHMTYHTVDMPEEEDFFKHILGGWVSPNLRRV